MVDSVKAKIQGLAEVAGKLSTEDSLKLERLIGSRAADGNCGNGCAGV
jgi:hypothetical protein